MAPITPMSPVSSASSRKKPVIERGAEAKGVEAADRVLVPAEQEVEDVDEQQAGEEVRQRHPRGGQHAAEMIHPGPGPGGRENTERQGDRDRQQEPARGQLEGGREPADQVASDRLAGGQRLHEVSSHKILLI
jgi:hypothetical protein